MIKVLVNNGATINILLASMLKKLNKQEHELILIKVIMNNFVGRVTKMKEIMLVQSIVENKYTMVAFYVVESKSSRVLCVVDLIHFTLYV